MLHEVLGMPQYQDALESIQLCSLKMNNKQVKNA